MSFSLRLSLQLAASLSVLAAANPVLAQSLVPTDPFAQTASDIPADRQVRFGVLPNGMQYALMHNATPPGQASLRLRIDAGSLMENEDQRGLAHFMEHMAFNGTTNIPENDLLRILERLGLAFGADTNASTGFDQTLYRLELPKTNDETVDTALRIMREQVSEALMTADAIDAERGVIEGEERLRNTPALRATKAQIGLLAAGQRLANRMPIGDLEIIRTAPRERFVEFYNGYYRPERATLVAVGDFDVDVMESKVRAEFGSWQGKAPAAPEPDLGEVSPRQPQTAILVEPGVQSSIQINWTRAPDRSPDTVAERRRDLLRRLGLSVLNRRLGEVSRADDPPFIGANGSEGDLADSVAITSVSAQFNPGAWRRALETIEQAQRRLVQYGVSEAELQRELTANRTWLENVVAGAATRRTPELAAALAGSVNDGAVFTSSQTDLDLFNSVAASVTAAEINDALNSVFEGGGPLVLVITPVEIEGGEAAVTAALEASRQVPVAGREAQAELDWPYTDFGTPGTVQSRTEIAVIGATVVTFANGVRLTVKPTSFRDEQILVSVRTGNGQKGMAINKADPQSLARFFVVPGGLGRLTSDELSRVLNDRVYSAVFTIDPGSYVLSGATRPRDLLLETQVLAAYLTDPGLRAASFEQIKAFFPQIIAQQMTTPTGAFGLQSKALLASGDYRDSLPTAAEIAAWTHTQAAASIRAGLATGPLDVIVVGDVAVEAAIASVASTFGALPARGPILPTAPDADQRRFPAATGEPVRLTYDGPAEQALAYIAWPTTDAISDRTAARQAGLLADVLKLRVTEEIRERQALAYSPNVRATASDTYAGYGSIAVRAEIGAADVAAYWTAIDGIATKLRDDPISEDELNRARLPVIEALWRSQATNEYWLKELAEVAERPADVEQTLSAISDLEAVTPADIQRLAQLYLKTDTAWRALVLAAEAGAVGAKSRDPV